MLEKIREMLGRESEGKTIKVSLGHDMEEGRSLEEEIKVNELMLRKHKARLEYEKEKKKMDSEYRREIEIIERESIPDQVWEVCKLLPSKGRIVTVMTYDHKPNEVEIREDLYGLYGGGKYYIKARKPSPMWVGTIELEGAPDEPEEPKIKKRRRKEVEIEDEDRERERKEKRNWKEAVLKRILEEDEELARKWALKEMGIEFREEKPKVEGKKETLEDIVLEELKVNPDLKKEFVKTYLKNKGNIAQEESEMDRFMKFLRTFRESVELLGYGNSGEKKNDGWSSAFVEAVKCGLIRDIADVLREKEEKTIVVPQYPYLTPTLEINKLGSNVNEIPQTHQTSIGNVGLNQAEIGSTKSENISYELAGSQGAGLKELINYLPVFMDYIRRGGEPAAIIDFINAYDDRIVDVMAKLEIKDVANLLKQYENHPDFGKYVRELSTEQGLNYLANLLYKAKQYSAYKQQLQQQQVQSISNLQQDVFMPNIEPSASSEKALEKQFHTPDYEEIIKEEEERERRRERERKKKKAEILKKKLLAKKKLLLKKKKLRELRKKKMDKQREKEISSLESESRRSEESLVPEVKNVESAVSSWEYGDGIWLDNIEDKGLSQESAIAESETEEKDIQSETMSAERSIEADRQEESQEKKNEEDEEKEEDRGENLDVIDEIWSNTDDTLEYFEKKMEGEKEKSGVEERSREEGNVLLEATSVIQGEEEKQEGEKEKKEEVKDSNV